VDFDTGGRQAGKVKRDPPDERPPVRFRGRIESIGFEFLQDEPVDLLITPTRIFDFRGSRVLRRLEGPETLVNRSFLDPLSEACPFFRGQTFLVRFRGRHPFILVLGIDPVPELAIRKRPRLYRRLTFVGSVRAFRTIGLVESQIGLSIMITLSMTKKAAIGKDRSDVLVEIDLFGARTAHSQYQHAYD